ncbi:hypothetical protein DCAR_0311280 [Daucus carota subsp. sativus]|nr:hypothetical protein DCAR_0311280 [Daucus carota subsp. sativus]
MGRARRLVSCFRKRSSSSPPSPDSTSHDDKAIASISSEEERKGGAVLVELFSSQGCATSPQAELLFSRLGRGDFELELPVILLAYHVDYWDYAGWKDPYSSSQWTVRQKAYVESLNLDTMFTPQIVVQGRDQCLGDDEDAMLSCIASAARDPALAFQATYRRQSDDSLQVNLTGSLRSKMDSQSADIMVALYESGLVNDCPDGANKGRVLANDYVVRRLQKLTSVQDISVKKKVSGTLDFTLWEGFRSGKCGITLFLQNSSQQIFGAQNFKLPDNL